MFQILNMRGADGMADLFGTKASDLMSTPQPGVTCNAQGAYVGSVPLLQRQRDASGQESWVPRPIPELNADLKEHYGLPVDLSGKANGLAYIAGALNRGDVFRAQIAMQQMKLPSAPAPAHSNDNAPGRSRSPIVKAQELLIEPWMEPLMGDMSEALPRPTFPFSETAPWRSPIPWDDAPPLPLDIPNGLGRYLGPLVNPYPEKKNA
jgi:hypothetical protein